MLLERRVPTRHAPHDNAFCHLLISVRDVVRPSRIRDLSASGMGVELLQHFEPGTVFTVELINPINDFSKKVLAGVAHCDPENEGHWFIGLRFVDELKQSDLSELL